jgi:hypothetical protein
MEYRDTIISEHFYFVISHKSVLVYYFFKYFSTILLAVKICYYVGSWTSCIEIRAMMVYFVFYFVEYAVLQKEIQVKNRILLGKVVCCALFFFVRLAGESWVLRNF